MPVGVCPNPICGQETTRLIYKVDEKTGEGQWGCPACLHTLFQPKVYTGKKLWLGSEVYGTKLHSDELRADTERAMLDGDGRGLKG